MALQVGQLVRFKDNSACWGVVFEFQDEGQVAGIHSNQKLKDMGCGDETHEPVENLEPLTTLCVGQKVFLTSDGPAVTGEIKDFLVEGDMVLAALKPGEKLQAMGVGDETHEPVDNLTAV